MKNNKQTKLQCELSYQIKLDEEDAYEEGVRIYRFTFKKGTLFSRVRKEMRKVAFALGYKPEFLFGTEALNFLELLSKAEVKRATKRRFDKALSEVIAAEENDEEINGN